MVCKCKEMGIYLVERVDAHGERVCEAGTYDAFIIQATSEEKAIEISKITAANVEATLVGFAADPKDDERILLDSFTGR